MTLFCKIRRSASVSPLMYGKMTYQLGLSISGKHSKNCPTSSSGGGTRVLGVKSLKICFTILSGYPSHSRVVVVWLSSSCLLVFVLSNVCGLCIRVLAALILCLMSWCELKSRYLSVCVGFLNTSILTSLPCSQKRIQVWPYSI